jgi:murein DD-endopeptidase MepM/ murein hydrolase activator NlpD
MRLTDRGKKSAGCPGEIVAARHKAEIEMAGLVRTRLETPGTPREDVAARGAGAAPGAQLMLVGAFLLGMLASCSLVAVLAGEAAAASTSGAASTAIPIPMPRPGVGSVNPDRDTLVRLRDVEAALAAQAERVGGELRNLVAERDAARRAVERKLAAQSRDEPQAASDSTRLLALETQARALQLEHATARRHVDRLRQRIAELEQRAPTAQIDRDASLDRLRSWVGEQSEAIETMLAKAGVNLDTLLERAADRAEGLGGPLRPTDDLAPGAGDGPNPIALRKIMASLPLAEPLADYRLMSPFGRRRDPINGRRAMHEGIDLGGDRGARIRATQAGNVVHAGREGAYGISVVIDHGMGITTRYAHLKTASVRRGQNVRQGQPIGIIGSTGRSTGRHLHYEVRLDDRPIDPHPFLEAARQRVVAAAN